MIINRKKIVSPQKYLALFAPNEKFYVAVPLSEDLKQAALKYGLSFDGSYQIPIPIGKETCKNANGFWKVRKDLPKTVLSNVLTT